MKDDTTLTLTLPPKSPCNAVSHHVYHIGEHILHFYYMRHVCIL